jgi:NAD(P)H-hydrate epimerase
MDRPVTLSQPVDAEDLDLDALAERWAPYAARAPIGAEQMRGIDVRAQRLGTPAGELMAQAGAAVAAAARATLRSFERSAGVPVLVLAGSGNNGGDALVAARHLAAHGTTCAVVLVGSAERPRTPEARRAWDLLAGVAGIERMHAASAHDLAVLGAGIERAPLVIDGLLGTGVSGALREPVASAVELCLLAHRAGVPVLAIDTPSALDISAGQPSRPNVMADVTVTFHRPKNGLLTVAGRRLCGRVLVAPIGIPAQADPGA